MMLRVLKFPWTLVVILLRIVLDVIDPQPKVVENKEI